jgi:hypothetical protein
VMSTRSKIPDGEQVLPPRSMQQGGAAVGLALFTLFSPELGLWVGTFHVIQSRTRVMGWHFSRHFAVKTQIDDSRYAPCTVTYLTPGSECTPTRR